MGYLHNDIAAIFGNWTQFACKYFVSSPPINKNASHVWERYLCLDGNRSSTRAKDSIRCLTFRKDECKSKKEIKIRYFLNSPLSNTDWCQNLVNLTWPVSFPRPQSSGRGIWAANLTLCATKATDTKSYGCRFPPCFLCVGYNKISIGKIYFRTDPRKFKLIVKGKRNASTFRGKRPLKCKYENSVCKHTLFPLPLVPRLLPLIFVRNDQFSIGRNLEIIRHFTLGGFSWIGSFRKKFQHKSSQWLSIESIVVWKIL